MRFNRRMTKPGMILATRSNTAHGRLTRFGLGSWSDHNAIVVPGEDVTVAVGESVFPLARTLGLEAYARYMTDTGRECRVYWPHGAADIQGMNAGRMWLAQSLGRPYDVRGVVRLGYKAAWQKWFCRWPILRHRAPVIREWEWADWCSESVNDAWSYELGHNLAQKAHPTPLTFDHRAADGTLDVVTGDVVLP